MSALMMDQSVDFSIRAADTTEVNSRGQTREETSNRLYTEFAGFVCIGIRFSCSGPFRRAKWTREGMGYMSCKVVNIKYS